MKAEELALVRGMADTKLALRTWQHRPMPTVGPWAIGSLLTAVGLLGAVWLVSALSEPEPFGYPFPGMYRPADFDDYAFVLFRNSLVLALHALACVAGFMAGSSLPVVAQGYTGWRRWIHDKAGPCAIGFVVLATLFSLVTQAYVLGGETATMASAVGLPGWKFVLAISIHALPELFALFLPLAAWTIASRRGNWHELLAATFVTVAIAVPILLLAGAVEAWVTPRLLLSLAG